MQEFQHPAISGREFSGWDLKYFLHVKEYVPTIEDPEKLKMAGTVFKNFEMHVIPKFPSLRQGVIHGDANMQNILVAKKNGRYEMAGVLDFAECFHSCYVFEVAIILAMAMITLGVENPLQISCPTLSGYLRTFPMSEEELDCLYYCVLARLCESAVIGEYKFKQDPSNAYLMTTPAKAWRMIKKILMTSKDDVDKIWTDARKKSPEDF